jgi:hypothetical protein
VKVVSASVGFGIAMWIDGDIKKAGKKATLIVSTIATGVDVLEVVGGGH